MSSKHKSLFSIALFLLIISSIYSQKSFTIDTFEGIVFDLTEEDIQAGYGKHIYQNEKLDVISLKTLNIPDRPTNEPFADLEYNTQFGIVFHNRIHIHENACLSFTIQSDDGSKVWIDDELIIDNGGVHKMKSESATRFFPPGNYPIKIWYFQAYHTRYGLIFDINSKGGECPENGEKQWEKPKIVANHVLFGKNEYTIKQEAQPLLNELVEEITISKSPSIKIVGHTDSSGSEQYNQDLSEKRAFAIKIYLQNLLKDTVTIITEGKGESSPITDNSTEMKKEQNRRVEIYFKKRN